MERGFSTIHAGVSNIITMGNHNKKKILVYNDRFFSLSQTFLYHQVECLSDRYEVQLLAKEFLNPHGFVTEHFKKHLIKQPAHLPGRIYSKYYRIKNRNRLHLDISSHLKLNRLFRNTRFHAIHAHFGHRALEMLGIAKKYRIPLVVTFHGHDASSMLSDVEYRNSLPGLFDYASAIIVVSGHMIESLALNNWMKKVHIIPCSVDPKEIEVKQDARVLTKNESLKIVHAGRIVGKKGVPDLIRVFHQLTQEFNHIELQIAGDGAELDECKELVRELKLEKQVTLFGAVSHDQIKKILNEADIFVLNSRTDDNGDMEGTPVTLLEAMSVGKPVVTTIHAGIPYVVDHEKDGLLVKERSNLELKEAITRLIESSDLRHQIGNEARKKIKKSHTTSALKNQLEKIFDNL